MSADLALIPLLKKIINVLSLKQGRKMGIVASSNIGDFYFTLSALRITQKIINSELIIITQRNSFGHKMALSFQRSDPSMKIHVVDEDINYLYIKSSSEVKKRFWGLVHHHFCPECFPQLINYSSTPQIRMNLTRPIYDIFNPEDHPELILSSPKKIFLIPHSKYHYSLDSSFWKSIIILFQSMGYSVIVNSKDNLGWGANVQYFYAPVDQIVPFADFCGQVFGVRSGITEMIAAETTGQVTMVNHLDSRVEDWFPFIPKNRIAYYKIPNVRSSGFYYLDVRIDNLIDSYNQHFSFIPQNILMNLNSSERHPAQAVSFEPADRDVAFSAYTGSKLRNAFCDIKYSFHIEDGHVFFKLFIVPSLDYEIHVFLIDSDKNKKVSELSKCSANPFALRLPGAGSYKLFIKIYHPNGRFFCHFETCDFIAQAPKVNELKKISSYDKYIDMLAMLKNRLTIFMASKDAHSMPSGSSLGLERLGVSIKPENYFRDSFAAIIDRGRIAVEELNAKKAIKLDYNWDDNSASLVSTGYNVNRSNVGPASIVINLVEYAVNSRGLNIVAWDNETSSILDSAAFDIYTQSEVPYRLNLKYL